MLKKIQVNDEVAYLSMGGDPEIRTVAQVTKTTIILKSNSPSGYQPKFKKSNGFRIGGNKHTPDCIEPLYEQSRKHILDIQLKREASTALRLMYENSRKLSTEQCNAILQLKAEFVKSIADSDIAQLHTRID